METTTTGSLEVLIGGQKYLINLQGDLDVTLKPVSVVPIPNPDKPEEPDHPDEKQPEMGERKKGSSWSENPGKAETWKIVNMTNPPEEFKIIAEDGLNVIAKLKSKEQAEALVNWFKTHPLPENEDGEAGEDGGDQQSGGGTGSFQPGTVFPYKVVSETSLPFTIRGPTIRHYKSGKPNDNTYEHNCKNIKFKNYIAVFEITVHKEWEHDDNLSIKIGGKHMDGGWFDNGISIFEGQTCLGTEKKHPSTKLCVVKGKKYGDLRGKKLQVASTYFTDQNKTEYWVNIPGVTNGWDKGVEGVNVSGWNPNTGSDEVQLRIDGFQEKDKPPVVHSHYVGEIAE